MILTYRDLGTTGRLGNALFEFAATLGIAAQLEIPAVFPESWMYRPYFSIPDELFGPIEENYVDGWTTTQVNHIDPRARPYMQDFRLFRNILPLLMQYLAPSELAQKTLESQIGFLSLPQPILGVHVRRGDNVPGADPGVPDKHLYHPLPTLNYYERAIETLLLTGHRVASIAVFSDDIEWCMKNIQAEYYHRGVGRPKEHEVDFRSAPVLDWIDLHLLARCDKVVVTGSTFGIWGAILSGSIDVVRPAKVYGPNLDYIDDQLLFHPSWIVLDN